MGSGGRGRLGPCGACRGAQGRTEPDNSEDPRCLQPPGPGSVRVLEEGAGLFHSSPSRVGNTQYGQAAGWGPPRASQASLVLKEGVT